MTIHEQAPAKINLGLSILGKRSDGYHDILSVFQTVDFCDELCMSSQGEKRLVCTRQDIPTGPENLVLKAEELFCERFGISERLRYSLEKRIPVGAGLAGGSSDAASALRGLRSYYGLDIGDRELELMATDLGSDIPFLIHGGTAVVTGKGEIVREVEWPFDFTYVIVYPGFGISTAWAYKNLGETGNSEVYRTMTEKLINGNLKADEFFQALTNDFEPAVSGQYPVLAKIKQQLLNQGADASLLTGSGSSVLGVFENEKEADNCSNTFINDFSGVFTVKASP